MSNDGWVDMMSDEEHRAALLSDVASALRAIKLAISHSDDLRERNGIDRSDHRFLCGIRDDLRRVLGEVPR